MGFKVGQSVVAQGQSGRVVYQRMAAPDYKAAENIELPAGRFIFRGEIQ